MSKEEIAKFADQELDKMKAAREEAIKAPFADLHRDTYRYSPVSYGIEEGMDVITAKGGLPYLGALPVGESKLVLLPKIPTVNPAQDGRPRKAFVVRKPNGQEEFAWTVNIRSPLYRDLLGFLKVSPVVLRVIRTGEGQKDTRYTVKIAE